MWHEQPDEVHTCFWTGTRHSKWRGGLHGIILPGGMPWHKHIMVSERICISNLFLILTHLVSPEMAQCWTLLGNTKPCFMMRLIS